jgi:hypothetical protein
MGDAGPQRVALPHALRIPALTRLHPGYGSMVL